MILTEKASRSIKGDMGKLIELVNEKFNVSFGAKDLKVTLSGKTTSIEPLGASVTRDAIHVFAEAKGTAQLTVDERSGD